MNLDHSLLSLPSTLEKPCVWPDPRDPSVLPSFPFPLYKPNLFLYSFPLTLFSFTHFISFSPPTSSSLFPYSHLMYTFIIRGLSFSIGIRLQINEIFSLFLLYSATFALLTSDTHFGTLYIYTSIRRPLRSILTLFQTRYTFLKPV